MMGRLALTLLLIGACLGATHWGYNHAVALRTAHHTALVQAVTRARDLQRMADFRQLRRCQDRVLSDERYEATARMVAHSALKRAGMAR